ncbi:DUF4062 domain-containing protein [Microbacterium fluvii]|uniref:DUF4062 domain-containing protein n=1 Tax=Microbacterium fluvii TaxID=415215 RepID=A0ABW2HHX4_9MICO|nr:DUF4062 domain-containing protein [Microbacterium fluvii]MCU4673740.1 DUF4062 domain-containing protein [Microbacterium fluvii]
MPEKAELRVFIASPAGLSDERDAIEQTAASLNAILSDLLDVTIRVYRWEQLTSRAGRPQALINPWVDQCDLFIGILHRRWGSPAGGEYETGFHEEIGLALKRRASSGAPDISLYFKAVDEGSLSDPGPDLARVIAFKRELREQHKILYQEFATVEELRLLIALRLTEVMHERGRVGATGRGYAPSRSAAEVESEVASEPGEDDSSSDELVRTLESFAALAVGKPRDGHADADRLLLFAIAASRDKELIPIHLANRVANRANVSGLRQVEANAWMRSLLNDMGRSLSASERVFPLGVFRDREGLEKEFMESVPRLLDDSLDHVVIGTARMLLALGLRTPALFGRSRDARENADRRWTRLLKAEPALSVRLWCQFARDSDRATLRRLVAGDSIKTAATASALLRATSPQTSLDELVDVDPTLIADESMRSYLSKPPASMASSARLGALVLSSGTPDIARTAALDELHRRREFSDDVVDHLLSPDSPFTFGSAAFDAEMRIVEALETPQVVASLERLLATADSRTALSRVRRWRLALTAIPPAAADLAVAVGRKFGGIEPELRFALNGKDSAQKADAIAVLERRTSPLSEFLGRHDYSAYPDLVKYYSDSVTYTAVQYLATLGGTRVGRRETGALVQIIAGNEIVSDDARDLLATIGSSRQIDVVVKTRRRRYEEIGDHLRSKLTLAQLSEWLESDDASRVYAALRELSRRNHEAPRRLTRSLMRHSDADVRVAAVSHLLRGADHGSIEEERAKYVKDGETYFYNVSCEFDRALANLPAYE